MSGCEPIIFLPGGGADDKELTSLKEILEANGRFRMISFPGWQHYMPNDFVAENLLDGVGTYIEAKVPTCPIRIVGLSLGAHIGYATAVRLQAKGRCVACFCAIDGTMSGYPWKQGVELLREGQLGALWSMARAKAQHSLIRLQHKRPTALTDNSEAATLQTSVLWLDTARAWTHSLDLDPIPLKGASTALLRTRPSAADDSVWKQRCPGIRIFQVPGTHHTFMDSKHIGAFRSAMSTAIRDWP